MPISRRAVLAGGLAAALPAVASVPPVWPPMRWHATLEREHPLVGRIWQPARGAFTTFDALRTQARAAHFVMVGEVHDNPDHHELQALLAAGRGGRAAFEHLNVDQAPAIAAWAGQRTGSALDDARALMTALDWAKSGWPDQAMFEPLFAAVLEARLDVVAADLPRDRMRTLARQGEAAMQPADRARVALDQPLPEAVAAALLDELEASHCGLMPRTAFTGMAFAQRARDAALADAMLAGSGAVPAILFAGNGHVRTDRGVAWYLERRAPERSRLSVLQLEVRPGLIDPGAYGQGGAEFILFTPGVARPDPCVAMRDAFQKRG